MRPFLILPLLLALTACDRPKAEKAHSEKPVVAVATLVIPKRDIQKSVVRINSTQQSWSAGQPWEKNSPSRHRALAAIVGPQQVLTTAELVADSTYLEFESTDGKNFVQAKVIAVDYEANLALLAPLDEKEGKIFFQKSAPLKIAASSKIGDALQMLQVEENGQTIFTPGLLQSVDVRSSFLPDQLFLTYRVKASMQSASSSYSLPVIQNGKLAGVLISYNSKDQICDISPPEVIWRFVFDATKGKYKGFPNLGITTARTEDRSFRQWLKLSDSEGGLFVHSVRKGGAADLAGVHQGDVLLAVDGYQIDRRGYYQHPTYGSLFWSHLIHGEKFIGDSVSLSLLREGQPLEVKAILTRQEESAQLVPAYTYGKAPNYLVKGGLVFQELTQTLLEAFGSDWQSRAPLDFLDALENPEKYEGKINRVVFLSSCIPTPATVGYEGLRNLIVSKVNGKNIKDMRSLIDAFKGNMNELHSIEFSRENFTVYLDDAVATQVDKQLTKRGISRLSRAE
jgi:S1-C subfamily serine protease